ncbi:MAG: GntR family transcriptional regulator [Bacteroidetes bacterium]|uniref:GntR family transcriptional regulator n=1 Tax=Candidatus Cryptobacteroides excrementavium TaxID=2840759 RepID=A0A9D9J2P4_9BACT|nr:GntR family transcriptional regulator [Candidatus Cryptobacteroides excrementavium]
MEFDANKPIYMQICDSVCDRILSGELEPGGRIPSVRDFGAEIGVNPNTVMRSYEKLTDAGIIFNRRGIGYFIADNARELVLEQQRSAFIQDEVPQILKKMALLGLSPEEVFGKK